MPSAKQPDEHANIRIRLFIYIHIPLHICTYIYMYIYIYRDVYVFLAMCVYRIPDNLGILGL